MCVISPLVRLFFAGQCTKILSYLTKFIPLTNKIFAPPPSLPRSIVPVYFIFATGLMDTERAGNERQRFVEHEAKFKERNFCTPPPVAMINLFPHGQFSDPINNFNFHFNFVYLKSRK